MKILFQKIIIEGFLSIGHAEINLADRGYCLIEGINNTPQDASSSNGSGKSSISSAIMWCITGETTQGISKNIVNKNTDTGCMVKLFFKVDGKSVELTRYKDHCVGKTNLLISVDGEDLSGKGIRDTEKLLSEYFPDLSGQLLGSVIILGQGLPQRFTGNTPAGRKEILEKLSKSDFMIEDLKNRVLQRKTTLQESLQKEKESDLQLRTTQRVLQESLVATKKEFEELSNKSDVDIQINALQETLGKLEEEASKLRESVETKETEAAKAKTDVEKLIEDKFSRIKALEESFNAEKLSVKEQLYSVSAEINSLSSEINRLKSIKDVCPTCGQKIPGVERPDTSAQESRKAQLEDEKKRLELNLSAVDIDQRNRKAQATSSIEESINACNLSRDSIETQLKQLQRSLQSTQLEIASKRSSVEALIQIEKNRGENLQRLEEKVHSIESKLQEIDGELLYIKGKEVDLESSLEVIGKMTTVLTRDFRGFLLSSAISFIDAKAKEYCEDIFGTNRVSFELDGNNIDISYDGKPYENLSGGEKQRIDLIVQFSIRDMLKKFLNFDSSILFLDEIFDSLDFTSCQKVISMLSCRLQDVESVFIVSHHQDLQLPVDSTISVVKDCNGVSSVR